MGGIHLPVADDQVLALAHTHRLSTSTPGSDLPSKYSRLAPPPVETWDTASSRPNWRRAATESPPPTAVKADVSATARATASVPARKASHSNTPIGPFQNTVSAVRITEANRWLCSWPIARARQPTGMDVI